MLADRIRPWWARLREPGWVRPRPTPRQQRIDVALSLVYLAACVVGSVLIGSIGPELGGTTAPLWERLMWSVLLAVALVPRRRFPEAAAVVVSTLFLGAQVTTSIDNTTLSVALFWAMYTVGAWSRHRVAAFWVRAAIIAGMFVALAISYLHVAQQIPAGPDQSSWLSPQVAIAIYTLLLNIGFFFGAGVFGSVAWVSARRRAQLEAQTAQLAAAQENRAQQAVMQERVRIARELHDVVAHHVSVMGVQASAARRVLNKSPELATDALTAVETTARVAIADLRGLLGVLRDPGFAGETDTDGTGPATENYASTPGIDQIQALISQSESAGLRIRFGVFGTPREVPPGLALCVFRVVQEALTNVIKHASATSVDVRLRYLDTMLEVEVTDDGVGGRSAVQTSGFGLIGMRERVAVYDGTLDVERRPGGFRVRARVRLRPADPAGEPDPAGIPDVDLDADDAAATAERTGLGVG